MLKKNSMFILKISKMTKIGKPMPGKVLIEPQAIEKKTASGIIIPDSAKEKPYRQACPVKHCGQRAA